MGVVKAKGEANTQSKNNRIGFQPLSLWISTKTDSNNTAMMLTTRDNIFSPKLKREHAPLPNLGSVDLHRKDSLQHMDKAPTLTHAQAWPNHQPTCRTDRLEDETRRPNSRHTPMKQNIQKKSDLAERTLPVRQTEPPNRNIRHQQQPLKPP